MTRGRGRPRHPDVLTPAEWRVVEHLRQGRTNAEIAVRLGISVNTVRFHVSHILDKLELSGREELKSWRGKPRRRFGWKPGPLLTAVAGGAAATAALLLALIVSAGSGGASAGDRARAGQVEPPSDATPSPTATALSEATPTVAHAALPMPFAQHGDYREYQPAELVAAGFLDTGTFIVVPNNPLPASRASYRAGFSAIEIPEAGSVDLSPDGWHRGLHPGGSWSSRSAVGLSATVEGVALYAIVSGQWGIGGPTAMTQLLPVGADGLAFYSIDGQPPELIVDVSTETFEQIPAIVDVLGHLWVRLDPIPAGPTADDTGERLAGRDGAIFGPLPAGVGNWSNLTWCEGSACLAILHLHGGGGLAAVSGGRATCASSEGALTIELVTDEFTLRFAGARPNAMSLPACEPGFPRDVLQGEPLSPHPSWETTALDPSGTQLNVAADRAGMLYVGVGRTIEDCPPCYTGN